jgi:hypothetical protein
MLRGDVAVLAKKRFAYAAKEWQEAVDLELGDAYFESAFARRYFFGATNNIGGVETILRDLYGLEVSKDKYNMIFSVEPIDPNDHAAYLGRLYLYTSYLEHAGKLSAVYRIWHAGLEQIEGIRSKHPRPDEVLFEKLLEKKYTRYHKAFNDQPSERRTFP